MGSHLEKPITEKHSLETVEYNGMKFAASEMQGWRIEMEDQHTVETDVANLSDHSFVAVYDGHGGKRAAEYSGAHMLRHITQDNKHFANYVAGLKAGDPVETLQKHIESALYDAFVNIDEELWNTEEMKTNSDTSGCTAVCALITPTFIAVANAGDSRAIISQKGPDGENDIVIALSNDHKPTLDKERERIQKAGGHVQMGRVDGDLALSRSVGDFQYKDKKKVPEARKVTVVPEILFHMRTPQDKILCLSCDGIWDVVSNEECNEEITQMVREGERDVKLLCEELLDVCLEKSSKDNMTTVIVAMDKLWEEVGVGEGVTGRVRKREEEKQRLEEEQQKLKNAHGNGNGNN